MSAFLPKVEVKTDFFFEAQRKLAANYLALVKNSHEFKFGRALRVSLAGSSMFETEPGGDAFRHTSPSKVFAVVSVSTTPFRISFQPHVRFARFDPIVGEIIEAHAPYG
jgi:hypothetical protein